MSPAQSFAFSHFASLSVNNSFAIHKFCVYNQSENKSLKSEFLYAFGVCVCNCLYVKTDMHQNSQQINDFECVYSLEKYH